MEVINFDKEFSLVSVFMRELRDTQIQKDSMRFRHNLNRIGQIMAYEISKRLTPKAVDVTTPLGVAKCQTIGENVVLGTILRAGLPFHNGFLNYFDNAQNAFVSAYRKFKEKNSNQIEINIEYIASPNLDGKTLIIIDPMLATGGSMELAYRALLTKGTPEKIFIASVIASKSAVEYIQNSFPEDKTTVFIGAIDDVINENSYIVPGLGDAGDLAYGIKE